MSGQSWKLSNFHSDSLWLKVPYFTFSCVLSEVLISSKDIFVVLRTKNYLSVYISSLRLLSGALVTTGQSANQKRASDPFF